MDKKVSSLFENWHIYTQNAKHFFKRLNDMLEDMDISSKEVKIITFASSTRRGEILYYDSNYDNRTLNSNISTADEDKAKDQLCSFFKIKKRHSVFNFAGISTKQKSYDEFGVIFEKDEETFLYGAALEYHGLEYHNKLLSELLSQICLYCKAVMDDENYNFESYMVSNLIYAAFKKQIDIDFFNTLAASDYEKKAAAGGIILVKEDRPSDLKLYFEKAYSLEISNIREIRKLLELSSNELYLIAKNNEIVGLGDYIEDSEAILFNGHQSWTYYDKGKELLIYKKGKYSFSFATERNFGSNFPKNFIKKHHIEQLNSILNEIKRQRHGTLIILSDEADAEVKRLCKLNRGYAIQPVDLNVSHIKKLVSRIIRIDGSIFLDTNLVCYGIGIILDGIAVKCGLSSRGSRYNSAKCYIDNKPFEKYVAIVISDDETTDIIYNRKNT